MPKYIKGIAQNRQIFIIDSDKQEAMPINPGPSQRLVNHSPDGFNWGYGGSGPAQLALAILLRLTDQETALANYQDFKWQTIAKLKADEDFDIGIDDIERWLKTKAKK